MDFFGGADEDQKKPTIFGERDRLANIERQIEEIKEDIDYSEIESIKSRIEQITKIRNTLVTAIAQDKKNGIDSTESKSDLKEIDMALKNAQRDLGDATMKDELIALQRKKALFLALASGKDISNEYEKKKREEQIVTNNLAKINEALIALQTQEKANLEARPEIQNRLDKFKKEKQKTYVDIDEDKTTSLASLQEELENNSKQWTNIQNKQREYQRKITLYNKVQADLNNEIKVIEEMMPKKEALNRKTGDREMVDLRWGDMFSSTKLHPKLKNNFWAPFYKDFISDPSFREYIKKYHPTAGKEFGVDSLQREQRQINSDLKNTRRLLEYGSNPETKELVLNELKERKQLIITSIQKSIALEQAITSIKNKHPDWKQKEVIEQLDIDYPEMDEDDFLSKTEKQALTKELKEIEGQFKVASALKNPAHRERVMERLQTKLPALARAKSANNKALKEATEKYVLWIADDARKEVSNWIMDSLSVEVEVEDDLYGTDVETITGPKVSKKSIRGEHIIYLIEMAKRAHIAGFQGGSEAYSEEKMRNVEEFDDKTISNINRNRFWQSSLAKALNNLYDSMMFDRMPELERRIDRIYNAMRKKEEFYLDFWEQKELHDEEAKINKQQEEEAKQERKRPLLKEEAELRFIIGRAYLEPEENQEVLEEFEVNKNERIARGLTQNQIDKEMSIWIRRKIDEIKARRAAASAERKRQAEEEVNRMMGISVAPPAEVPESTPEVKEPELEEQAG